ncbi:radical SAM protein [bacterium]|nr:radical SAM protein [bacterium]
MTVPPLRLLALEITRTCTLACRHCRGDSRNEVYPDELSLGEIGRILDSAASFSKPIVIVTGGEPLVRPDVFDITAYSSSLGLTTVLATCGQHLSENAARKLIDTGVSRISVSLDGADARTHDSFRGIPGAFEAALRGIAAARSQGLAFQINSTITSLNIGELDAIHDLAVSLGAVAFHPFLLVPMGRGKGLSDNALPPEEYESALIRIAEIAERSPIELKPTCSPHYGRVARQLRRSRPDMAVHPENRSNPHGNHKNGLIMTRGCLGGYGFVFVSHVGAVQMCGFLELEAGNLRRESYDLKSIWETSPLFNAVRDRNNYRGTCGKCEYWQVCGGCRARAYYLSGDYLAEEPNCLYIPGGEEE